MSWNAYKLGDILERKRDKVDLLPDEYYKLVTIKMRHKGVVLREEKKGKDIKSNMHFVKEGDFILSGIDARNGAFGIVPKELDNAIITNDFWCLEPKKDILRKDFFLFITSTSFFDYICNQCSDGTTQRIRLQRDKFYNYEVVLPVIEEQEKVVKSLTENKQLNLDLSSELKHQLNLVKELRQAFLREAMQGKLVKQNETDESATELLAKIRAEKEQLVKEKKIKKQKPLPPISEDEIPFEIPENWVWCRLGEICETNGRIGWKGLTASEYTKSGPLLLSVHSLNYGDYVDYSQAFHISQKRYDESPEIMLQNEDILICKDGAGIGKLGIIKDLVEQATVNSSLLLIRNYEGLDSKFAYYFLLSSHFQKIVNERIMGATTPHLYQRDIVTFLFALPSFSEQKRIVDKLDELMAYCDVLEEIIKNSQVQNEMLLSQVLREALEPKRS